ncbi:heparinase II/III family protein [Schleiferiaceae bacterium]|nr:heparinase II/III family protein [Schleiferiaceae bacterium]
MVFVMLRCAAYLICILTLAGCVKPAVDESSNANYLLFSEEGANQIALNASHPIISESKSKLEARLLEAMRSPLEVPIPKDPGGGYTHEKHKKNYAAIKDAGTMYLLTKDATYLDFTKNLLLEYAELYPTLDLHPQRKNQGPGKLFWQVLNDEVALVHFIQGFDAIKSEVSPLDSARIVDGLFIPMVQFIKDDSQRTFRKIHNHAMWGVAGVGMTALVLDREDWLEESLFGPDSDTSSGYFAMIDALFSPDGYYSEGPYYQRYALMPLAVLAQALVLNRPELKVLEFKDSVVLKAIETTFELSDCNGYFFPVNDAIKAKSIQTPELGYALPMMYAYGGRNSKWLDAIKQNGNCVLTDALINLEPISESFNRSSRFICDGAQGETGGMSIFRSAGDCSGFTSVLKFGTHGMGHGHFDQLGLQIYIEGMPFISDYGASRFHNIPQKEGGRYLKENNTWANQTIAHNTLVVNGESQYRGVDKDADKGASHLLYKEFSDSLDLIIALDTTAYSGKTLMRYHLLLELDGDDYLIDIQSIKSDEDIEVDAPFYFNQHRVNSTPVIPYNRTSLNPFGGNNGYEHLWLNGGSLTTTTSDHTWQIGTGFVSMTQAALEPYNTYAVTLGANDPNNNLYATKGLILRTEDVRHQAICTIFEKHGHYDPVFETTSNAFGAVRNIEFMDVNKQYIVEFDADNSHIELLFSQSVTAPNRPVITIKRRENE